MPADVFTTIFSSLNPLETQLMAGLLESEGIESFVDNDHMVGINWLYSNAVGGVTLRVYSEDADRAQEIIAEAMERERNDSPDQEQLPLGTDPATAAPSAEDPPHDRIHPPCPECGGTKTAPQHWPVIGIFGWFFGLPLVFRDRYRCRDCGTHWREK